VSQPNTTHERRNARRKRWIGATAALLLVGALAVQAAFTGISPFTDPKTDAVRSDEDSAVDGFGEDSEAAFSAYLEEIGLIAEATSETMAKASADASAQAAGELESTAGFAADALAKETASAGSAVEGAAGAGAALPPAPEDYMGGSVTPSPGATSVPSYKSPSYGFEVSGPSGDGETWDGSESEFGARVGINQEPTGDGTVDGGFSILAEIWLEMKQDVNATGSSNGVVQWADDDFGTWTAEGENLTYTASPDEEGAAAAEAHARQMLEASQAVLTNTLAGMQAKVEVESELYATVYAEINATLAAEKEAEAAINAEAEARVDATFAAAAEKEAEINAKAEYQFEQIHSAQFEAKKRVRAEAEQHVEAIYNTSAEASERLEAQAEQTQEAAAEAIARIEANMRAALEAAYKHENLTGTDMSARIQAVAEAAMAAEASVRARAEEHATLLLEQAAAMRAAAEVKAEAVLQAAIDAEAQIDAKAELAVRATLRAQAYALAKVRAEAEAQADAHLKAAQRAVARARVAAEAHIRAVVQAAMSLSVRMYAEFDGSKPFSEMVHTETDQEVGKDISYIKEVQSDYERQAALDRDGRAEHWENVTYDLENDLDVVSDVAADIDATYEEYHELFLTTYKDLDLLGEKFL